MPGLADAVKQASPSFVAPVESIVLGRRVSDRKVRRVAMTLMRYVLRASGRPTPFGLFAGVTPVALSSHAQVQWRDEHRPIARVDSEWLADVICQLEAIPELLARLHVVFNDLTVRRGNRLEVPSGKQGFSILETRVVRHVRQAAGTPIALSALVATVGSTFPGAETAKIVTLLTTLTRHGFLITSLRAPLTVTDPLRHVIDELNQFEAGTLSSVTSMLGELEAIHDEMTRHNHVNQASRDRSSFRESLGRRMRNLSKAGRTPLAVDLLLACNVNVPSTVAEEMEQAATVLMRLSRHPVGLKTWHDYHVAFCDRYGVNALIPLLDVVDRNIGLGYPAGFPGSIVTESSQSITGRDEQLLALAWQAVNTGNDEIVLTEENVEVLSTGEPMPPGRIPSSVEVCARIHSSSSEALERGDFKLTMTPGRAAGTLTSRFVHLMENSAMRNVFEQVPPATADALSVQLSVPPVSAHAENVSRAHSYLPLILSLGELRLPAKPHLNSEGAAFRPEGSEFITLDDLAVTASRDSLHLVSISRRQVIEPQIFNALALDTQLSPLARFIAQLPRAFMATWRDFEWGPSAERLSYMPRVRFSRTILSPARWNLSCTDVPGYDVEEKDWLAGLAQWLAQWKCPAQVELRNADHTLRLDLNQPAHCAILRSHLNRHKRATLTETAAQADDFGWIDGHAHEVVVPLFAQSNPVSANLTKHLPVVDRSHGQMPGSSGSDWLYAQVNVDSSRQDEVISQYLPLLQESLTGDPACWFVRYRDADAQDHLRLRIAADQSHFGSYVSALGQWADALRDESLCSGLILDTYHPEIGRYGSGEAMQAAEAVFAADTSVVVAEMRQISKVPVNPIALAAYNIVDIALGFLGNLEAATAWLIERHSPLGSPVARPVASPVIRSARMGRPQGPGLQHEEVVRAKRSRASALRRYRSLLPADADVNAVLELLVHMHHNRALGINREREHSCLRLARQAALAWQYRKIGSDE
ncbi:lantibiotic dehydratase [Streptomyces sp. NPDC092903]|uniref:lantibiotic dehydratase n=1 Tax=Streptomyces sp. NPDC092903 TaxID=3366017 RepID=UPI0038285E00